MFVPPPRKAFTLIELLIVVAIIAILAAIAVPNFLEAQTRAKVSRVQSDMRALATAIESYRVDHGEYPEGTDNPGKFDPAYSDFFGPLAAGYYTFATRTPEGAVAGRDFFTITTPIAYMTSMVHDPFAAHLGGNITYRYRNAKDLKNGYIITSFGPAANVLTSLDGRPGVGTRNPNPLSTWSDPGVPARLGDINERAVIHYMEGTGGNLRQIVDQQYGSLSNALEDLAYDPTNGTTSTGDIYRIGPMQ